MKRFLHDNALSLVMFALFLVCWGGQSVTGWIEHNQQQAEHGQPAISWSAFVRSGEFLETTGENWESEFFQMAVLVVLSACLIQRGSPESKKPDGDDETSGDPREHMRPDSPAPVRRGGLALQLYSQSLSIALTTLFLLSFVLHAVGGRLKHNEEARQHGQPELTLGAFMRSAEFWYQSFQNWQSEFLSIGALIVLTIFLRQRGSPQSKPVWAPHAQTGH